MAARVQLSLNVDDIEEAVAFYGALFGVEPAKRRDGYANFEIASPPLKLVLEENPGRGGTLNHWGYEVDDTDAVLTEQRRLGEAGLKVGTQMGETCCFSTQDKFWVEGTPGDVEFEVYTVLADSPTRYGDDTASTCCA